MEALNQYFKPIWENAIKKCISPSVCSIPETTVQETECLVKAALSQLFPEENESTIGKIWSTMYRPLSTNQWQKLSELNVSEKVDFFMNQFNDHALEDPKITKISEKISEGMRNLYTEFVECIPNSEGVVSCLLNKSIKVNCNRSALPIYDALNQPPMPEMYEIDYAPTRPATNDITEINEASEYYEKTILSVMNVAAWCIVGVGILVVVKKAMKCFRHLHQQ